MTFEKAKHKSIILMKRKSFLGPIGFASVGSLAYSSIFPSTSVMVNWHQQGCLTHLKDQWLIDAAVRLNPKLRLSPKCQQVNMFLYLNKFVIIRISTSYNYLYIFSTLKTGIITCYHTSGCF